MANRLIKVLDSKVEMSARALFSTPQGQLVLEELEAAFPFEVVKVDGKVDSAGTVASAARAEVIQYLRSLAEPKKEGTGA